jgi:hypothetical protein
MIPQKSVQVSINKSSKDFDTILVDKIIKNLQESGFSIIDDKILFVPEDKDFIRNAHANSVAYLRQKKRAFIAKVNDDILDNYVLDGKDLDLDNIHPNLIPITRDRENNIFNWVKLHWSIPISAGYGRRLRYLVYDKGNSALIGIIGLADPVYGLSDRDRFIGWSPEIRKKNLKHIMDAFVLGAIPPYSYLLGGKLVSSLLTSNRITGDFKSRYGGKRTLISNEVFDGKLAAITTASALGKSSIYDRIRIEGGSQFLHVGWSKGSGEFQFFNGVYDDLFKLTHKKTQTSKNKKWGTGVRNRRTVIRTGLKMLGLPPELLYHNIKRELFLVPLGEKSLEYLRGESKQISYFDLSTDEISEYAIKRWVKPRALKRREYLYFRKESYSLIADLVIPK